MRFSEITPISFLSNYINQSFKLVFDDKDCSQPQLFLPEGQLSVIYLHEGGIKLQSALGTSIFLGPAILVGCFTNYQYVYAIGKTTVYGTTLPPQAAMSALRLPAGELTDCFTPLHDIIPSEHGNLIERLAYALSDEEIQQVVQLFLARRIAVSSDEHVKMTQLFNLILINKGLQPVTDLADKMDMSIRSLQLIFKDHTGLSLKKYLDLCRFNYAKSIIQSQPHLRLTDIGHQLGYYDQSHFIKHFKRFAGIRPKEFHREQVGMGQYFGLFMSEEPINHVAPALIHKKGHLMAAF